MPSGKILICAVLLFVWHQAESATLPLIAIVREENERVQSQEDIEEDIVEMKLPIELTPTRVGEGAPIPLCAGRCASPPAGPVCAFDATGTARTFATLCELEAASCRDSIYYAITSLGEC